jgi:hypothetical protein
MKQAEDKKTRDLLESEAPRRGRPPKADALTGAERAKRFRDAHRDDVKAVTITVTEKEFKELQRSEQSRTFALASAHSEIRILIAKLAEKDAEIAALKSRRRTSSK